MSNRIIKSNTLPIGEKFFQIMSVQVILTVSVIAQIAVLLFSSKGSFFPDTDAFQSIVGTCAEIIAGLYGITLAGYTFFLSRIDGLCASDMTLDYVLSSIKNRFKYLIWYITFNVLMTLFTSIVLMYAPVSEQDSHMYFYRLFCNEFLIFTGFSMVLILYYSVLVIDPNCVQKEAAKLKRRICRPGGKQGSTSEFIALYDSLEESCNRLLPQTVLKQIHDNKGKRFEYTIALLDEEKRLPKFAIYDLIRIHRYYECMINAGALSVAQEMCDLARQLSNYMSENMEPASKQKLHKASERR